MMLYDVLKASKGLYVNDSFAMLWGKQLGSWKIAELTGTLPMIFRSNGTALIDYRIYGTADGAGTQTENLYNYLDDTADCILMPDGTLRTTMAGYYTSDFIAVEPGMTYAITRTGSVRAKGYDSAKQSIRTDTYNDYDIYSSKGNTFTVDNNTHYIRFTLASEFYNNCTLVPGSTPPETYIPYGYKLPLTVTNSIETKTTDVYIGDSKLGEAEYVDYGEQKIYRRNIEDYLEPTDPPLPLPAIETFSGENTLDSTETVGEVTIKGRIKEVE